jgi:TolB-like protein/Tfp pilus assembly protein PilF
VLILAISGNSADSKNVVKELALASEGHKNILPVYLESVEVPESMAYQLAGIQRVEFFEGNDDSGQQSVIRALAKLGVKVSEEASIAAAGAPKGTSHGSSYATTTIQAPKSEGAAWSKIAATIGGVGVLAIGLFFLGGSSETTVTVEQTGTNATNAIEQDQPLAKLVTLDTNRVVVLPFKTIGTSGETADLGYGLVSTLTSKLQPLKNLVVIAKESARKFKDSEQSPREIGQALGAGTIVTGEIQTSSDKVQVNIQIVNANTEALGWGSTFNKMKDGFLDLQNEIATKLAIELKGKLVNAETQQLARKATENPEAQAAYQAGRREWNKRSKLGFENAIKHFEKAIELDSNYADPYVGLSNTHALLPIYNFSKPSESMPMAEQMAEKALSINPKLGSAHTAIAFVKHFYSYDWEFAEKSYKKAIELNPNYATGYHWYSLLLIQTAKTEETYFNIKKAKSLDPESMIINKDFGILCLRTGNKDYEKEAINALDQALIKDPYFAGSLWAKHHVLFNNPEEGIKQLLKAREIYPHQPNILTVLIQLNWKLGNREVAYKYLVELLDKYKDSINRCMVAEIYFQMGKIEDGLRWLKMSADIREPMFLKYSFSSLYKIPYSNSQFRNLYKKINHPLFKD